MTTLTIVMVQNAKTFKFENILEIVPMRDGSFLYEFKEDGVTKDTESLKKNIFLHKSEDEIEKVLRELFGGGRWYRVHRPRSIQEGSSTLFNGWVDDD